MKITAKMRAWLVEKGMTATASDDDARKLVGEKLASGELTAAKFAELSAEAAPSGADQVKEIVAAEVRTAMAGMTAQLTETIKGLIPAAAPAAPPPAVPPPAAPPPPPAQTTPPPPETPSVKDQVTAAVKEIMDQQQGGMGSLLVRSADILSRPEVRVKSAIEQYTHHRSAAHYPERCGISGTGSKHALAGRPATYAGVLLEHPSERDKAISGAYFKFALAKAHDPRDIPRPLQMTDHDKDLINWSIRNSKWTGFIGHSPEEHSDIGRVDRRLLTPGEQKALLDDSISGGIEIVPIEFDDALITTPVLYGELFPLVSVTTVTRGRRMRGATIGNPTFTSGISEGTPIEPFNTANFIGYFDTTIYTAVGAMEIGLDFEEDTPANIGQVVIQRYGEKWLEWLDRVIVVGDGSTEPEGMLNSSAVTLVTSEFGPTGPPTVSDYEGLLFGISKAVRNTKGARNVFIGNDTSYRRFRSIPVGPGDERRISGMDYLSYTALEHPYKIQNDIPNGTIAFANLGYYQMYRRLGLNIRIETAGATLALKNTKLIVVRARMGGRMGSSGTLAVMRDAQS